MSWWEGSNTCPWMRDWKSPILHSLYPDHHMVVVDPEICRRTSPTVRARTSPEPAMPNDNLGKQWKQWKIFAKLNDPVPKINVIKLNGYSFLQFHSKWLKSICYPLTLVVIIFCSICHFSVPKIIDCCNFISVLKMIFRHKNLTEIVAVNYLS